MRFRLLTKTLLPVLVLALGIMFAVCYSIISKVTEVITESRELAMRTLAHDVGENISAKLQRTISDLRLLSTTSFTLSLLQYPQAALVTGHSDVRTASDMLMGMTFAVPDYVRLELVHQNGSLLAGSAPTAGPMPGLTRSPCFREALKSGQTMLSEPFFSPVSYDLLVAVCQPVSGVAGQPPAGVLVATLNTASLAARVLHDPLTDVPRNILVLSGNGMILASLDPYDTGSFQVSRQDWYKALPPNQSSGLISFNQDNKPYLAAYYRTDENWVSLVILDQEEIYTQASLIRAYGVIALVLASVLLGGSLFWILRAVARDVRHLSEYATNASRGMLQNGNPHLPREDELGDLYTSIGDMVNQLKEKVAAVEASNKELITARSTVIEALSMLVENRDPETGNHVRRTQTYVRLLAEQLRDDHPQVWGFSDEQMEMICSSAPLHDVGKVGISDAILFKQGRLTAQEFEVVKQHTVIGYMALSVTDNGDQGMVPLLRMAAEIALTHHERWDGSGYPHQLKGEAIPRSGRLMALADVYDALISHRVYKPPFPHTVTVETIAKESGKQFDPLVVAAFLKQCEVFRSIAREFADNEQEREATML